MAYTRLPKSPEGRELYDFFTEVDKRSLPGHQGDTFQGFRRNIREVDSWVAVSPVDLYWPDRLIGAKTVDVVSSSAADDGTIAAASRTGAGSIRIDGIIEDFQTTIREDIVLTGTTPVTTTNKWFRINRVIVRGAGTDSNAVNTNQGNITLTQTGTSNVVSYMPAMYGTSLDGRWSVWRNSRAIYRNLILSADAISNFDVQLQFRKNEQLDSTTNLDVWRSVANWTGVSGTHQFDLRNLFFRGFDDADWRVIVKNNTPIPADVTCNAVFLVVDQRCLIPAVAGSGISFR